MLSAISNGNNNAAFCRASDPPNVIMYHKVTGTAAGRNSKNSSSSSSNSSSKAALWKSYRNSSKNETANKEIERAIPAGVLRGVAATGVYYSHQEHCLKLPAICTTFAPSWHSYM